MKTKIKPPKMTKEQKIQQRAPSAFARIIPADQYNPRKKLPSRRDLWREEVAERKHLK